MTKEQFNDLRAGDAVRIKGGADGYIVHSHNGESITVVRIMEMTNPAEWDLICKANRMRNLM